jgi:sec-independent protein translocase protein TatA
VFFVFWLLERITMFGLQPAHLLIIAVVAGLFFVPSRLPELTRALGKSITEFRKGLKDTDPHASNDKPQSPKG